MTSEDKHQQTDDTENLEQSALNLTPDTDAPPAVQDDTDDNAGVKVLSLQDSILRFLAMNPVLVGASALLSILIVVSSVPIAYGLWRFLIPNVWETAMATPVNWLWAWFVIMILAVAPIWVFMGGIWALQMTLSVTLDKEFKKAFDPVRKAEDSIEKDDKAGLLPLLKYSRLQLEAYYKIGLTQTRRSFLYSVVAMWVGFIFIVVGFAVYLLPIDNWGLVKPEGDIKTVVIAGGAIIEFVSALFLWVYRSSTNQLTYFYNRQIHSHNVVLCFRIASSMEKPDEAKRSIVDKVLDRTWEVNQSAPVGAKWFGKLVS